jgi:hypothetical protein
MTEWIHVGIEYPPLDKSVLVTDGESFQIRILRKDKKIKYWETSSIDGLKYNASYWMPLPDLPI